eukprot:GHVL01018763.1.p1 GENE.GHVL01018763.1~~GHVL01018763.1.p1  ORF type:complete len:285 (-),score=41.36 GHVL01018763.1:72-926(-)
MVEPLVQSIINRHIHEALNVCTEILNIAQHNICHELTSRGIPYNMDIQSMSINHNIDPTCEPLLDLPVEVSERLVQNSQILNQNEQGTASQTPGVLTNGSGVSASSQAVTAVRWLSPLHRYLRWSRNVSWIDFISVEKQNINEECSENGFFFIGEAKNVRLRGNYAFKYMFVETGTLQNVILHTDMDENKIRTFVDLACSHAAEFKRLHDGSPNRDDDQFEYLKKNMWCPVVTGRRKTDPSIKRQPTKSEKSKSEKYDRKPSRSYRLESYITNNRNAIAASPTM